MHLSRLGLLVHLVASLPWWHPSTSALPWHGSILGVLLAVVFRGCWESSAPSGLGRNRLHLGGGLELAFTPPLGVTLLDGGHVQSEGNHFGAGMRAGAYFHRSILSWVAYRW